MSKQKHSAVSALGERKYVWNSLTLAYLRHVLQLTSSASLWPKMRLPQRHQVRLVGAQSKRVLAHVLAMVRRIQRHRTDHR